jgi:hypothetical protein
MRYGGMGGTTKKSINELTKLFGNERFRFPFRGQGQQLDSRNQSIKLTILIGNERFRFPFFIGQGKQQTWEIRWHDSES